MDELSILRELLDEPSPSANVVAEGRSRLLSEPARSARTVRRIVSASTLSLTAAAAAALLVVAIHGSGSGTSPTGSASVGSVVSARSVLLAAAVHAASAPTNGRYWHVRSLSQTTLPGRFGHGQNRYSLEQWSVAERWTTHSGRTWLGRRQWVRPKTREDEAAWKRDGAPRRWCLGHTDTSPPEPICLATAPGTSSLMHVGQDTFQITEGHDLTLAQLQRLPTEPERLRGWLVGIARHDLDASAGRAVVDLNVEQELANLLVDFPVPPDVRAAAFRALAEMPHVSSIGATHDELGRPGVGITIRFPHVLAVVGDGSGEGARQAALAGEPSRTLIIDPKTSIVLEDQTRIDRRSSEHLIDTVIQEVGWSDQAPHRPAMHGGTRRAGDSSNA